jgi:hypothetical protein
MTDEVTITGYEELAPDGKLWVFTFKPEESEEDQ